MSPTGTTLGFVGLAFTDRTNIQVLGQPIRLDYHHTDVKLRTMAAQYFGALRKATNELKRYYECDFPKLEALSSGSDIRLPCYSLYRDLAQLVFIQPDMYMATSVTLISWSGKMVNRDSCWWILIGRGKLARYVIL